MGRVLLNGVPVSAQSGLSWRLQSGTAPYQAVLSVHRRDWSFLRETIGRGLILQITDSDRRVINVRNVTILEEIPSRGPNQHSFILSDLRWTWHYRLISRRFNIAKKTGDTSSRLDVPYPGTVTVDEYDYRPYSLDNGKRWTPKRALESILEELTTPREGDERRNYRGVQKEKTKFIIESLPIEKGSDVGGWTLQNVIIDDPADLALTRILQYIPGAVLWVDQDGIIRVFDGTDLAESERHLESLPPTTWAGDFPRMVDRIATRPRKIRVHYTREVECMVRFQDNWGPTQTNPNRNSFYSVNVIPQVDSAEGIEAYDPEKNAVVTRPAGIGTWVEARAWLSYANSVKPASAPDWTFGLISVAWLHGDVPGVLGARFDTDPAGNAWQRAQTFVAHFRQTFQMNRRVYERVDAILPVRSALLDTVTGSRAPAACWGEATFTPSDKGKRIASRFYKDDTGINRIVEIPTVEPGESLADKAPGPARVQIVDEDVGVYALEWTPDPFGVDATAVPCHLVDKYGSFATVQRDLGAQDDLPCGYGIRVQGGTNGIFLKDTSRHYVLLTVIPAAPNNTRKYHVIELEIEDISKEFRKKYGLERGDGPTLDLFVPPGEITARFAWGDDAKCEETLTKLLGLDESDPAKAGIDGTELPGFILANGERQLRSHAVTFATETLAQYADALSGSVSTIVPDTMQVRLRGNMDSVSLEVGAYPSGKVSVRHDFTGRQRQLSRFALLPPEVRAIVLGILPLR